MAAEKVQPVPWVWRVATRRAGQDLEGASRRRPRSSERLALEMTALDDDQRGPRSWMRRAASRAEAAVHDVDTRQHGRLGRVRSDDGRERQQQLAQGPDRVFAEQAIAALGDHHRIHHERG